MAGMHGKAPLRARAAQAARDVATDASMAARAAHMGLRAATVSTGGGSMRKAAKKAAGPLADAGRAARVQSAVEAVRGAPATREQAERDYLELKAAYRSMLCDMVQFEAASKRWFDEKGDLKKWSEEAMRNGSAAQKGMIALAGACAAPLLRGVDGGSACMAVGAAAGLMLTSPRFRAFVAGNLARLADAGGFGELAARFQAQANGGRVPYTPETAAMQRVALTTSAFETMRAYPPGCDTAEARRDHVARTMDSWKRACGVLDEMCGRDGVDPAAVREQERYIVGLVCNQDDRFATYFAEVASGKVRPTEPVPYVLSACGQKRASLRWDGLWTEAGGGEGAWAGSFTPRPPMDPDLFEGGAEGELSPAEQALAEKAFTHLVACEAGGDPAAAASAMAWAKEVGVAQARKAPAEKAAWAASSCFGSSRFGGLAATAVSLNDARHDATLAREAERARRHARGEDTAMGGTFRIPLSDLNPIKRAFYAVIGKGRAFEDADCYEVGADGERYTVVDPRADEAFVPEWARPFEGSTPVSVPGWILDDPVHSSCANDYVRAFTMMAEDGMSPEQCDLSMKRAFGAAANRLRSQFPDRARSAGFGRPGTARNPRRAGPAKSHDKASRSASREAAAASREAQAKAAGGTTEVDEPVYEVPGDAQMD